MPDDQVPERGSVLLLFPAAFLVVLVLGAIAIDAGVLFLEQRELAAAAGAAANDAATLAVDHDVLRTSGQVVLDPARAEQAVAGSLASRGVLDRLSGPPQVLVDGDRITVSLTARADYVIARALPGTETGRQVAATAGARAAIGS